MSIDAETAARIIRYLGAKPYNEVADVIAMLKNHELPEHTLAPLLNYIIRDDAVYSFIFLKNKLTELETKLAREKSLSMNATADASPTTPSTTPSPASSTTSNPIVDADNIASS
jgi:hypothetical protein